MKLRAEIDLPDNADWQAIEDAKACAQWRRIYSLQDRMSRTDLENKCGLCIHYLPIKRGQCLSCGRCVLKHLDRERSQKKCKLYERRKDE